MLTWLLYLPASKTSVAPPPLSNFGAVCSNVSKWLPPILPNCLALMIQMYAVSFFTAIPFYIYNNGIPPSLQQPFALAFAFAFAFPFICFHFCFHFCFPFRSSCALFLTLTLLTPDAILYWYLACIYLWQNFRTVVKSQ